MPCTVHVRQTKDAAFGPYDPVEGTDGQSSAGSVTGCEEGLHGAWRIPSGYLHLGTISVACLLSRSSHQVHSQAFLSVHPRPRRPLRYPLLCSLAPLPGEQLSQVSSPHLSSGSPALWTLRGWGCSGKWKLWFGEWPVCFLSLQGRRAQPT